MNNQMFPPCPKCKGILVKTEADGLWCTNQCYVSEFALWEALQAHKSMKEEK